MTVSKLEYQSVDPQNPCTPKATVVYPDNPRDGKTMEAQGPLLWQSGRPLKPCLRGKKEVSQG